MQKEVSPGLVAGVVVVIVLVVGFFLFKSYSGKASSGANPYKNAPPGGMGSTGTFNGSAGTHPTGRPMGPGGMSPMGSGGMGR